MSKLFRAKVTSFSKIRHDHFRASCKNGNLVGLSSQLSEAFWLSRKSWRHYHFSSINQRKSFQKPVHEVKWWIKEKNFERQRMRAKVRWHIHLKFTLFKNMSYSSIKYFSPPVPCYFLWLGLEVRELLKYSISVLF